MRIQTDFNGAVLVVVVGVIVDGHMSRLHIAISLVLPLQRTVDSKRLKPDRFINMKETGQYKRSI